jgi:hypothetical protein
MWTDLKGYEGIYQINDKGDVLALESIRFKNRVYKEKILKGVVNNLGYKCYDLYKDGKRMNVKAHHLVAKKFVDGYKEGLIVNHKDGNKLNNHFSNLEWVTHKENSIHSFKYRLNVKKGKDVIDLETGVFYESIGDAFRSYNLNISLSHFKKQLAGKTQKNHKFIAF